MRRKDKEITDRDTIDEIVRTSDVMRLGMSKNNMPYIVPLCYGYDGQFLYFHSARKGMKNDYMRNNPKVCFEIEKGVALSSHETVACKFSFKYQSVIGFGEVSVIKDKNEKKTAFDNIMKQYSDKKWNIPDIMMGAVALWKIKIDSIYGKQSKQ